MIHILHGENLSELRKYILQLKKEHNASLFETKSSDISVNEVTAKYFTSDIFSQTWIVALEVGKDKSFDFESLLAAVSGQESPNHLIMWQEGVFAKSHVLLKAPLKVKGVMKEFKLEPKSSIFAFTDALFEKKRKEAYKEYWKLISDDEEEFGIFSMVISGLRNIALAKTKSSALEKVHPFVQQKAVANAKRFSESEIAQLYSTLYEYDLSLKTGKASVDVILPLVIEKITGSSA